jgi:hypothetical protein
MCYTIYTKISFYENFRVEKENSVFMLQEMRRVNLADKLPTNLPHAGTLVDCYCGIAIANSRDKLRFPWERSFRCQKLMKVAHCWIVISGYSCVTPQICMSLTWCRLPNECVALSTTWKPALNFWILMLFEFPWMCMLSTIFWFQARQILDGHPAIQVRMGTAHLLLHLSSIILH